MTADVQHITVVDYLAPEDRWAVHCDRCGRVGVPEDHFADAAAIADRHQQISGFEARS